MLTRSRKRGGTQFFALVDTDGKRKPVAALVHTEQRTTPNVVRMERNVTTDFLPELLRMIVDRSGFAERFVMSVSEPSGMFRQMIIASNFLNDYCLELNLHYEDLDTAYLLVYKSEANHQRGVEGIRNNGNRTLVYGIHIDEFSEEDQKQYFWFGKDILYGKTDGEEIYIAPRRQTKKSTVFVLGVVLKYFKGLGFEKLSVNFNRGGALGPFPVRMTNNRYQFMRNNNAVRALIGILQTNEFKLDNVTLDSDVNFTIANLIAMRTAKIFRFNMEVSRFTSKDVNAWLKAWKTGTIDLKKFCIKLSGENNWRDIFKDIDTNIDFDPEDQDHLENNNVHFITQDGGAVGRVRIRDPRWVQPRRHGRATIDRYRNTKITVRFRNLGG